MFRAALYLRRFCFIAGVLKVAVFQCYLERAVLKIVVFKDIYIVIGISWWIYTTGGPKSNGGVTASAYIVSEQITYPA